MQLVRLNLVCRYVCLYVCLPNALNAAVLSKKAVTALFDSLS